MPEPLILTLLMDANAFGRFDGLRRRHFPAALNRIPAHATLFHHLPGAQAAAVESVVAKETRGLPPPEVAVTGVRFTGRGVAFTLESDVLGRLRARVAEAFAPFLTAQDRQGWRPHVTVQNKVAPETARALHAELAAAFVPFRFRAPGLALWRYLGGPWAQHAVLPFGEE